MVCRGLGNSPLIGIETRVKSVLLTTNENENWIREPQHQIVHNPRCLQPRTQLSMPAKWAIFPSQTNIEA